MFELHRGLDCIEAVEADITCVHKSKAAVAMAIDEGAKQLYDAFIVGVKEDDELQVYIALAPRNSNRALIYTAAKEATAIAGKDLVLKEALSFIMEKGFDMEPVSLNYSTALREVVLRGIRVITMVRTARHPGKDKLEQAEEIKEAAPAVEAAGDKPAAKEQPAVSKAEKQKEAARIKAEEEKRAAEEAARVKAEEKKRAAEEAARIKAEEEKRTAEEAVRVKAEEEKRAAEEAARIKAEEERRAAEEAAREAKLQADIATEERQEAEKLLAEKVTAARLLKEKLQTERLAANQLVVKMEKAETEAAAKLWEEKKAADKLEAERIEAAKRVAELVKLDQVAEKKAIEAQECLNAAADAKREAEEFLRIKSEEEAAAAEKAEAEKAAAIKASEARVAAEEAVGKLVELKKKVQERAATAEKAVTAITAEKTERKKVFTAKEEELNASMKAMEAEQEVLKQLLHDKILAEKTAREKAGIEGPIPITVPEADLKITVETVAATVVGEEIAESEETKPDSEALTVIAEQKAELERLRLEKLKAEAELRTAAAEAARIKAEAERMKSATVQPPATTPLTHGDDAEPVEPPPAKPVENKYESSPSSKKTAEGELNVSVTSVGAWKRAAMTASETIDYGGAPVIAGSEPFSFLGEDGDGFFTDSSSAGGSGAEFTVDPAMPHIEFSSPDEIIEIQESSNLARVALEGNPTQNCRAYICAVKKQHAASVHVGILLTDSNKLLIYSPSSQPETIEAWSGTVADAVQFLELIGFMMATVKLGTDKASRTAAIKRIPVLHQADPESS